MLLMYVGVSRILRLIIQSLAPDNTYVKHTSPSGGNGPQVADTTVSQTCSHQDQDEMCSVQSRVKKGTIDQAYLRIAMEMHSNKLLE